MGGKEVYDSETLLKDLGGCGKFQVFITLLIELAAIPAFFSFNIETFGIYNPGWKCVGNATSSFTGDTGWNTSSTTPSDTSMGGRGGVTTAHYGNDWTTANVTNNGTSEDDDKMWTEYGIHSCKAYESCPQVEFSPDASTILTEWGLTCNRGWILSTMLSVRMAGYLCSTLMAGYVGDRFGRRIPFLLSRALLIVISLVMMFSVSWQMYAALSFAVGFIGSYGMLGLLVLTEYVTPSWRIKVYSIPSWPMMAMLFAVVAMFMPDWRTLRLIVVVLGSVVFIPILILMPESLRWLSVNGKESTFMKLISKIAKVNKVPLPPTEKIDSMVEKNREEKNKRSYTVFHLFRKGYRLPTLIIGFINFSTDVIYYAFNFGVAALPGNFYTNLIIFSVTDLPANLLAFVFANRFARKPTMLCMFGLCSLSIFGIVAIDQFGSEDLRLYGINSLVMVAKMLVYIGWIVLSTSQAELFPTVIRTTINGYGFFFSSLGGIFSPYFIPSDPSTFYISYLAMAILALICTGLLFVFPETKGKPLIDRWDDDIDDDDNDDNDDDIGSDKAFIDDGAGVKVRKGKGKHEEENLVV